MAEPLADDVDVAALYGEIADADTERVSALLRQASRQARVVAPMVDTKIASGEVDAQDVADVVATAVARALRNPQGVKQQSETRGPFSASVSYDDRVSAGYVFFTDAEIAVLGGSTASHRNYGTVVPCPRW